MSISRKIKKNKRKDLSDYYVIDYKQWWNDIKYSIENNICDICKDMIVGENHCSCNRFICNEHFNFDKNICHYCCNPDEVISHLWEFRKFQEASEENENLPLERKTLWKI
ncbi:hypothetical protein C6B38_02370 [Spiroplasma sp. ChiS]|uniref:hypothetical protein n=1 Tax=Spiroplasma sp. ChiS TaxID=2099885 RepID=UPI000CF986B9|nr:hypothetical protein [Spiroplasma sp. ChiS]PQP79104.1 hypothetical protein C6B38_02370 [Spiroplasma sp. ChiS]